MKTKITIILLAFTSIIGYSQTNEFAPIGAKWWYSYSKPIDSTGLAVSLPFYIESIGDSIIKSKNCRILKTYIDTTLSCCGISQYNDTLFYVYSDSNKVYYYNTLADTFCLLYNFNANVNDTLNIFINYSCSISMIIDSIKIININDNLLKQFTYHLEYYNNGIFFYNSFKLIEKIGVDYFLFFDFARMCSDTSLFSHSGVTPLRCYTDNSIGEFHSWLWEGWNCDDTVNGYIYVPKIHYSNIDFIIFPNPIQDIVTVKPTTPLQKTYNIELFNCYGALIFRKNNNINESSIDISDFPNGIYYLKLYNYETNNTFKLVKK